MLPYEVTPAVGVRRYMRTKLRMDPTMSVEKTKSSSLRPKLGREAMSLSRQAMTPMSPPMSTLNENCGSVVMRAAQLVRNRSSMPNFLSSPPPKSMASRSTVVGARGMRRSTSRAGRRRGLEAELNRRR
jgi:hypothetical protein